MTDNQSESPAQLLAAATAAARLTRAARHGFWFPLALFGLLVIGAAPWYAVSQPACPRAGTICGVPADASPAYSLGPTLYWFVAVGLGYAATLGYYGFRGRRVGVAGRIWPYLAIGIALFGLTLLATPGVGGRFLHDHAFLGDLSLRGMMPLLALALGLFALARLERSAALAVFAVLFLAVALLCNLYDVENQSPRIGWTPSAEWVLLPNLWLAGFTLLLGGFCFGLVRLLRDRARFPQGQLA